MIPNFSVFIVTFCVVIKVSPEDEYDVKKLYQANPRHELTCRGEVTNW